MGRETERSGSCSQQGLGAAAAAEACGMTTSALRMWEKRYGWPKPDRTPSGYRKYSADLIEDIKRMNRLIECGHSLRELIIDGVPQWPSVVIPKRKRITKLRELELPASRAAARFQREVVQAFVQENWRKLRELLERGRRELSRADEIKGLLRPMNAGFAEMREIGHADVEQVREIEMMAVARLQNSTMALENPPHAESRQKS